MGWELENDEKADKRDGKKTKTESEHENEELESIRVCRIHRKCSVPRLAVIRQPETTNLHEESSGRRGRGVRAAASGAPRSGGSRVPQPSVRLQRLAGTRDRRPSAASAGAAATAMSISDDDDEPDGSGASTSTVSVASVYSDAVGPGAATAATRGRKRGRPPTRGKYVGLAEAKKRLLELKRREQELYDEAAVEDPTVPPPRVARSCKPLRDEAVVAAEMRHAPTPDLGAVITEKVAVVEKVAGTSKNLKGTYQPRSSSAAPGGRPPRTTCPGGQGRSAARRRASPSSAAASAYAEAGAGGFFLLFHLLLPLSPPSAAPPPTPMARPPSSAAAGCERERAGGATDVAARQRVGAGPTAARTRGPAAAGASVRRRLSRQASAPKPSRQAIMRASKAAKRRPTRLSTSSSTSAAVSARPAAGISADTQGEASTAPRSGVGGAGGGADSAAASPAGALAEAADRQGQLGPRNGAGQEAGVAA
ncbi:hypothetical protein WN55_03897 [Dufourea novaeangliae]|uniref:Uncharacterized protein n=1 Tax=Dufourea novaeangliae TaxID=178035 RepID=A0A154PKC2_DUFNO|nr:hypothetical protein WN55_03897 [Dufourea novaeangliae]